MRLRHIRCKDITGGIHLLPYVENVHHSADTYEIHSLSKRYLCVPHTEFYSIENKIAEHVAIFLLPDKKNVAFTANIKKRLTITQRNCVYFHDLNRSRKKVIYGSKFFLFPPPPFLILPFPAQTFTDFMMPQRHFTSSKNIKMLLNRSRSTGLMSSCKTSLSLRMY